MTKNDSSLITMIKQAFSALSYEHSSELLSVPRKYQVLSTDLIRKTTKDNSNSEN